jgi:hypothetical protein
MDSGSSTDEVKATRKMQMQILKATVSVIVLVVSQWRGEGGDRGGKGRACSGVRGRAQAQGNWQPRCHNS